MYKVLLVDDEVLVREAISEIIGWEELGLELVGTCQNGKEAMEFMKNNIVDMVLTDICMPYVDGIELSEFIYKKFPNTRIIIFSGFDEFEYAKKAIKYNVEEYLLKPITAAELSKILTDVKAKMDQKKKQEKKINVLNETYKKNRIYIKSKILADFITGSRTYREIMKELRGADIQFSALYYKVGIIEIRNNSDLLNTEVREMQHSSIMAFAVYNISDEIINHSQMGTVCLVNNNRVLILFKNDDLKEFRARVKNISIEIHKQVKKHMNLDISITIGSLVKNHREIYRSYEAAQQSIKYQFLFGENSIIDSEDINNTEEKEVVLEDKIDDLILEIKMNNKQKISKNLYILQGILKQAFISKNISLMYLQQVAIAISEELRVANLTENTNFINKNKLLTDISNTKTLDEGIQLLTNYCFQVAEELITQKDTVARRRALLAMDYIKKNYSDTKINLNAVCSYLNISASRFSTIFKDETGETFMEALLRVRMEKAKELLENTDLKNYEIAEMVGFSDPHYFSIAFKKMTGKSPTEHAKSMK